MSQVDHFAPGRRLLSHGGQHSENGSQRGFAVQPAGTRIEDQDVEQEPMAQ
jgi:hypothetical protein